MLAELKRKQEAREAGAAGRQRRSGGTGDFEDLDDLDDEEAAAGKKSSSSSSSLSTNLHVSNLDPHLVDEASLLARFGPFGRVASVKIMWPFTEEERQRGSNSGFVAFMERGSAERALRALDGERFAGGRTMRVGWAGAVPLPARALNEGGSGGGGGGSLEAATATVAAPPSSLLPAPAPLLLLPTDARALRAASDLRRPEQERSLAAERAKATAVVVGGKGGAGGEEEGEAAAAAVVVAPPSADALRALSSTSSSSSLLLSSLDDACARFLVDCVAAAVASDGLPLERALARAKLDDGKRKGEEEEGDGEGKSGDEKNEEAVFNRLAFGFLRDPSHPWSPYYRWRLFSLAHGDALDWWSGAACRIVEGGRVFVPPPREEESGRKEEKEEKTKTKTKTKTAKTNDEAAAAAASASSSLFDPLPPAKQQHLLGSLLPRLTLSRGSIAEAMEWCLRESAFAPAVAELLLGSRLTKFWLEEEGKEEEGKEKVQPPLPSPPLPPPTPAHIAACLLLASDVLSNSASARAPRGASRWRLSLASLLPEALEALSASVSIISPNPNSISSSSGPSSSSSSSVSRMKQEACKVVVGRLLRAWRAADAFEPEFVDGLAASFFGFGSPSSNNEKGKEREKEKEEDRGEREQREREELEARFSALSDREVELLARRSGVSLRGGRRERLARAAGARRYGERRRVAAGGGGGGKK